MKSSFARRHIPSEWTLNLIGRTNQRSSHERFHPAIQRPLPLAVAGRRRTSSDLSDVRTIDFTTTPQDDWLYPCRMNLAVA